MLHAPLRHRGVLSWRLKHTDGGGREADERLSASLSATSSSQGRGEVSDAVVVVMGDCDRLASLFIGDGAWRIPTVPDVNAEAVGGEGSAPGSSGCGSSACLGCCSSLITSSARIPLPSGMGRKRRLLSVVPSH
jgi:hypothetical protein